MQVSPVWASWKGLATNYAVAPLEYWVSITITLGFSLLLLLLASRAATRVWADRPQRAGQYGWLSRWHRLVRGTIVVQKRFRTSLLDVNPILWLASRERHVRLYPWIFLTATVAVWVWGFGFVGKIIRLEGSVVTFYMAHVIFKYWLATATCATLNTDGEKASLELLLSTPLRVRDVIAGHWLALRRLFGAPFLTLLTAEVLLFPWICATGFALPDDRTLWIVLGIFSLILLFADCAAIGWLGMWLAIKQPTPHRAASSTVTIVLILPWVVLALIRTLTGLLHIFTPVLLWAVLWLVISIVFDLLICIGARQLLLANLRQSAAQRYAGKSP